MLCFSASEQTPHTTDSWLWQSIQLWQYQGKVHNNSFNKSAFNTFCMKSASFLSGFKYKGSKAIHRTSSFDLLVLATSWVIMGQHLCRQLSFWVFKSLSSGSVADAMNSILCVPSQKGGLLVYLHPHNHTVESFSATKRSGPMPLASVLWEPSQKGCRFGGGGEVQKRTGRHRTRVESY